MPKPFLVDVPQSKLDSILERVRAYRWFPAPAGEGEGWEKGTNTLFLKSLCEHWTETYDWRANEARLNRFPQYVETIEGIDIHFVHLVGESNGTRPLILTHGWPGSHYEFWNVIDQLAFPSRHGGSSDDAFDIIVPSLPGFGFSGKTAKPIGPRATARIWNSLMTERLSYHRYIAQGGDLGSLVTTALALNGKSCAGIHLNMVLVRPSSPTPLTDEESIWLDQYHAMVRSEGAYLSLHTTKPQTISMSLMDSPVGAAAWILEKFHGWSDLRTHDLAGTYSMDRLLTSVMIYLVNDAVATSIWFYRGLLEEALTQPAREYVVTPTGIANFLGDPVYRNPPRTWIDRMFNIAHWSDFSRGGHFAAAEQPLGFVEDLRQFARAISY